MPSCTFMAGVTWSRKAYYHSETPLTTSEKLRHRLVIPYYFTISLSRTYMISVSMEFHIYHTIIIALHCRNAPSWWLTYNSAIRLSATLYFGIQVWKAAIDLSEL